MTGTLYFAGSVICSLAIGFEFGDTSGWMTFGSLLIAASIILFVKSSLISEG